MYWRCEKRHVCTATTRISKSIVGENSLNCLRLTSVLMFIERCGGPTKLLGHYGRQGIVDTMSRSLLRYETRLSDSGVYFEYKN